MGKLSRDTINDRLKQNATDIQVISDNDSVGIAKHVKLQCQICDFVFEARLGRFLYHKRNNSKCCPRCEYNRCRDILRETGLEIISPFNELDSIPGNVQAQCLQCHTVLNSTMNLLVNIGTSCPNGCMIKTKEKYKHLKGVKVGRITIISNLIYRVKNKNCVRGVCECGNMLDIPVANINELKKRNSSCYTCGKKRAASHIKKCGIYTKFGSLTIVSEVVHIKKNTYVQTRCDKGHVEQSFTGDLTSVRKVSCTQCKLIQHNENNKAIADRCLQKFGATRITENIPNSTTDVVYLCQCGKKNKIKLINLKMLAKKTSTINCKCSKLQKGVYTSNAALKTHENLGRGVHNYAAKSGNIDIALAYKGKKIAIEYDEWWWHKDKQEMDKKKTTTLLADGWYVLRLRVNGFIPDGQILQKALKRLVKTPSRLLLLTHKSWKGYKKDLKDSNSELLRNP